MTSFTFSTFLQLSYLHFQPHRPHHHQRSDQRRLSIPDILQQAALPKSLIRRCTTTQEDTNLEKHVPDLDIPELHRPEYHHYSHPLGTIEIRCYKTAIRSSCLAMLEFQIFQQQD